jgi:hypothetical protein
MGFCGTWGRHSLPNEWSEWSANRQPGHEAAFFENDVISPSIKIPNSANSAPWACFKKKNAHRARRVKLVLAPILPCATIPSPEGESKVEGNLARARFHEKPGKRFPRDLTKNVYMKSQKRLPAGK